MGKAAMLSNQEIETIRALRSQGFSPRYIAWKIGRDSKTVIKYGGTDQVHRQWTEQEKEKVIELRKSGLTAKQIAEQIGRTVLAVSTMITKLQRGIKYGRDIE